MRRLTRTLLLLATLQCIAVGHGHGQSQMLLPYNQSIFQASWENPAARPLHRFSIGLPVLSSLELGVVNNGFTLKRTTEFREGKLYVLPTALLDEASRHKRNQQYVEMGIDLLHFRMAWRDWFFWVGARHVTSQSFLYSKEFIELAVLGNNAFVGETLDLSHVRLNVSMYNEVSFGFSQVHEAWTWGARASFLMGMVNAHVVPNKVTVSISNDPEKLFAHTLEIDAVGHTAGIPVNDKNYPDINQLTSADYWKSMKYINVGNPGFALAGGVSYRPEERTNLTLSFSDVGMLFWGDNIAEYSVTKAPTTFEGLTDFHRILRYGVLDWGTLSRETLNKLKPKPEVAEGAKRYRTWLSPKMHLMATYDLARQTTAGFSFSAILHSGQFYPSATMSLQQGFSNLFAGQIAISYNQRSIMNFGASLVFTPGPFQLYAVCDNVYGLIKPKDLNAANVRVGLNLVFGPIYSNSLLTHR